jgi:hypothetical protein
MATTRERREARAERRRDWAESREAKAAAAAQQASDMASLIPVGEPIHDGSRGARQVAGLKRLRRKSAQAFDHSRMAERHEQAAAGIERQLEHSVYSDDVDAAERLRERIADNEAKRDGMKVRNAEFRKANRAQLKTLDSFQREQAMPHPPFELTNLGARIRRDQKRLDELSSAEAA